MSQFITKIFYKQRDDFARSCIERDRNLTLPDGITVKSDIPYINELRTPLTTKYIGFIFTIQRNSSGIIVAGQTIGVAHISIFKRIATICPKSLKNTLTVHTRYPIGIAINNSAIKYINACNRYKTPVKI